MIFSRAIEADLRKWKSDKKRKPLILRGARQVGKTFLVRRFGSAFDRFVELNLERPGERALFADFDTGRELFDRILLYKGAKADPGRTLLFIDEIQHSSQAVQALRYFHEDIRELSVIAAGSLLEVFSQREGFSSPVGRVHNLFLFPVSFREYLGAHNPPLAEKLGRIDPLEASSVHRLLMDEFDRYVFAGGMPEALSTYCETGTYSPLMDIYDDILMGYQEDVEKYTSLAQAKYLSHAIDRAPLYAGERITYEKFGESAFRSREMKQAFDVLEKALLVYRARPSSSTRLPVIEKMRKAPKLFFLDTGLVNFRSGFRKPFTEQSSDNVYRGHIAEQITAQELLALSTHQPSLQFWAREKGAAEIDFVYTYKDKVIPIEVKSGKVGKLKSLHLFMGKSPHPWAVRVWSGKPGLDRIDLPSGKTYTLCSIPFYLLSRLEDVLERLMG